MSQHGHSVTRKTTKTAQGVHGGRHVRISTSVRDLITGAVACVVLVYFFARIELVELVFDWTRQHEDWDLDEILAGVPALAVVAAWFAARRRREAVRLSVHLEHNVAQLREEVRRRRELQEQLREAYKVAAVGTVAGGLAHELNDVLQPIVTLSQLHAERPETPAEVRSGMRHIQDAAERGREIVKHSLSFTTGGTRDAEQVVPARWLAGFVARARKQAGEVTIATRFGTDAGSVRVNSGELEHVMDNLLRNAVEAMQQRGTVTVVLDTCTLNAQAALAHGLTVGDFFRIDVTDEGPGMADEVRRHVFDPFFTTKGGATKGGGDGTGLGLAVVYRLVRGWEGNISVHSEPGAGATFSVLIPRLGA